MKVMGNNKVKASLFGAVLLLGSIVSCAAQADQTIAAKDAQSAATATTQKVVHLPLDHGPRAEVTPWVNEQRRLHAQ